ncbi:GTP binding signal recognition particle receptor [Metschnikowia bicuspidata var. bicuspidata NRRL YB-4993]|uniref:Signal recognition particle receptor subunit alpha homolog n=1 Tax=Metschnikowia bicuspidata var. bicuspidata NRRL YB-4993 TaxID=869754 RepID=A0A1A0H5J1_9ASCO|nr:GTP binding signal recognition particle receptor [Metschnikowia bicuspidata var. bicuspidata NRRL YB-4993]OBA19359.1 GTP binding signal recognition particle receptor [Metschnikowia bicuspidata var. bicuspidata NRRL YB-4993]
MSQSLIVFEPSGRVLYQQNNKISPFNDLIYSIVDESYTELERNFYTVNGGSSHKRFYCLKVKETWAAIYFDMVFTFDSEKIRHSLLDVLRTYSQLHEEDLEKMAKLIDFQFNNLVKLKVNFLVPENEPNGKLSPVAAEADTVAEAFSKKKTPGAKGKKMRRWVNGELVDVTADDKILDYSESRPSEDDAGFVRDDLKIDHETAFTRENDLVLINELHDVLGREEDEDSGEETTMTTSSKQGFLSKITSYFGSSADIKEVSKKFTDQLISKNIAPPTAKAIIDRIESKIASKTVTIPVFKQVLTDELTKILTPNVSTDLLYDIKKNKRDRPYVISVVGVNGVGKSTNLAKLAFWFLQNNMNVLICACDTFRSGAVEQLKVHVNNLQRLNSGSSSDSRIELFEKGYGGGDHVVTTAKLAIAYASSSKFDIVLIDTAGRTHSNAKLMAPLKKFGDAADPDRIIMVGEALVGTDSVEQATNFNNAFGNRRSLDFFIISKVDTVGDLVGAMINMVMATRVPILFVGTGQTYTDIKKLSVKRVVDMLTA